MEACEKRGRAHVEEVECGWKGGRSEGWLEIDGMGTGGRGTKVEIEEGGWVFCRDGSWCALEGFGNGLRCE